MGLLTQNFHVWWLTSLVLASRQNLSINLVLCFSSKN